MVVNGAQPPEICFFFFPTCLAVHVRSRRIHDVLLCANNRQTLFCRNYSNLMNNFIVSSAVSMELTPWMDWNIQMSWTIRSQQTRFTEVKYRLEWTNVFILMPLNVMTLTRIDEMRTQIHENFRGGVSAAGGGVSFRHSVHSKNGGKLKIILGKKIKSHRGDLYPNNWI